MKCLFEWFFSYFTCFVLCLSPHEYVMRSHDNEQRLPASQSGWSSYVLLSCGADQGSQFLESALLAGIVKPGNKLLVPCYDLPADSLDKFRYSGAEITVMRMEGSSEDITLQSAMVMDLLSALTDGILNLKLEGHRMKPSKLSCADTRAWQQGLLLVHRMRNKKFFGRSGTVSIDEDGERRNLSISVLELSSVGLVRTAVWTTHTGYLRSEGTAWSGCSALTGKCLDGAEPAVSPPVTGPAQLLEIVTVLSAPYTMLKTDAVSQGRVGNDRYEGFAVDLIVEIARIVDLDFTITLVTGYGSRRADGSWTGMIGEILEGRADMAIGDMRSELEDAGLGTAQGRFKKKS